MNGESLGRRLLRLDAVYCAGAGLIAIVFFAPLAGLLEVPRPILVSAGAVTILWAFLLYRLSTRAAWRAPVAVVAAANGLAAASLVALAAFAPGVAAGLLLAAVALEVAAFAVSQAVALRR